MTSRKPRDTGRNETNEMWRAWREDQKRHASKMAADDIEILNKAVAQGKVTIEVPEGGNGYMRITSAASGERVDFWVTRGTVLKNKQRFANKGAKVALKAIGVYV